MQYIEENYRGEDKEVLLRRIDEIPWDEDGYITLDWIFEAKWFNDKPCCSDYGPRYEAPWEGMVLEIILHEAYKYYFDKEYGIGSFAELILKFWSSI